MSEFVFPTYGEWLAEYELLMAASTDLQQQTERLDRSAAFSFISPVIKDILELPSRRDYYEPERAALVLETIYRQTERVKPGSIAYATWMTKLADDGHPQFLSTSLMGAEISRGIVFLATDIGVQEAVVRFVREVLSSRQYSTAPAVAGQLVREWLKDGADGPLASWLRARAIVQ